ncbi:MAG: hypothetical protein KKE37_04580 [Verrucomicrobia bacterium]|nr:hypothetical protein [Verrucomicrobiota bacterium]MBU4292226.1 hypothetical protein [Verrucomicrobiota bacterium]MBU4428613.1 hypothetical protein [Verrucomicrobiota bacterium]MCG2678392.1 hypothetical protein [Kiritimatiellia bacterium]
MKTTIDIADSLLIRSRAIAQHERVTFRQMVEEGLAVVIARHERPRRVCIKPVTVKGRGLSPEFRSGGWPALRNAAYEGHGA